MFGGIIAEPLIDTHQGEFKDRGKTSRETMTYDRVIISYILPIVATYEDGSKKFYYAKGRAIFKEDFMFKGKQIPTNDVYRHEVGVNMAKQRAEKAIELFVGCNFDRKDFIENYWDTFNIMQIVKKEELSVREIILLENRLEMKEAAKKALEGKSN